MLSSETYYGALAARLKAVPGLRTFSRRLKTWADVPEAQQPAVFLTQTYRRPNYAQGRAVHWNLGAEVYVYAHAGKTRSPGEVMNPLLDGVLAIFSFDNAMRTACTLGGLCLRVEVGEIETDEGSLGEQAVARIPVNLEVVGSPI